MAEDEEYEMMPYSEISDLKKNLKKIDSKGSVNSDELMHSVVNLTQSIDSMLQLFKTAVDEMKLEEKEESALGQQVKPIVDKLNEIIEQNKIIAEGMVAISDIIRERYPEKGQAEEPMFPSPPPASFPSEPPAFGPAPMGFSPPPQRSQAPPQFPFGGPPSMPPGMDMPPSPPQKRK